MIPQFEEIRLQALRILSSGAVMKAKELRIPLGRHFQLTEEEMTAWYPSGNGEIFLDRIQWALSYLYIAGLVDKPHRGDYQISSKGLTLLSQHSDKEINEFIKSAVQTNSQKKSSKTSPSATPETSTDIVDDQRTPQEVLDDSYNNIKRDISSIILKTILSKKPYEFERLVVKLLQLMGYGGEIKNSGIVTKLSKDGGIDGIIKEDVLGFNHISIQAKRYAPEHHVRRDEVQNFVGAVAGTSSKKGVFITTSDYTKAAVEYVEGLNGSPTIILINGQQLVEYIYDYGLGLQTEKVLKVMKLDSDFWDSLDPDDKK